jgi:hypothetical protein
MILLAKNQTILFEASLFFNSSHFSIFVSALTFLIFIIDNNGLANQPLAAWTNLIFQRKNLTEREFLWPFETRILQTLKLSLSLSFLQKFVYFLKMAKLAKNGQ